MGKLVLIVLALLAGYLLFWPVPVNPVAWQAPKAPELTGPYAPNQALASVEKHGVDVGTGPEDVAIDPLGQLYVGYDDGRIVRFDANGGQPQELANTGGRPLGLDFDPAGNLVIADGYKGLLRMDMAGNLTVLATEADGLPFGFTDDVDVAADGMIYFSDASSRFGPAKKARDDIIEHGGHGRLLQFDPERGITRTLLDGLQFANGVAMCPEDACVLVTQTGSYNIIRYWLTGEKAGSHDVLLDNLPGIPDGISGNGRGQYWLALFTPRNALLDWMSDKPFLRKMAWRLPDMLQPQPAAHAFVLGLDQNGNVTHNLQHLGPDSFHPITSVEEYGDRLFLGSLTQPAFASLPLPEVTAQEADNE